MQDWFSPELERFKATVSKYPVPTEPMKLSRCETIVDHDKFTSGHFEMIEKLKTPYLQLPYVIRMERYCKILESCTPNES